jgi:hypothetical protein
MGLSNYLMTNNFPVDMRPYREADRKVLPMDTMSRWSWLLSIKEGDIVILPGNNNAFKFNGFEFVEVHRVYTMEVVVNNVTVVVQASTEEKCQQALNKEVQLIQQHAQQRRMA